MVFCGPGLAMLTTFEEKVFLLRPSQERHSAHAVEISAILGAEIALS